MRKVAKLIVIYFPVVLVTCQVLANLLSFVWYDGYIAAAFYLNHFFGVNVLFAFFLLAFTYWFKFCAVSRYAAWAEVLFAVNFLIVQEDNLYNIMFQVIVGIIALLLTLRYFVKRFPLCSLALIWTFLGSVTKKRSCSKGLDLWKNVTYDTIKSQYYERGA
jgi:hypothetical protein